MRIGCLQFAPQVGDVDNNLNRADAVLSRANPDDLDVLVLPELAFSGYNFKSLQDITPFLEPSGSGITSLWARTIALKYNCTVTVGYPEKVDVSPKWPTGPEYYNSVIVVNADGETIANYRKSFLYQTDETWALEGGQGFYEGFIPGLGNTSIGICNPYKFEAPWSDFEFAHHVLEVDSNLVIVSMAWMTREDPRRFTRMPNEPDMETLTYWVTRLEPLIRAESQEEIIVIFCNRCGNEDEVLYAGTSAVVGIHDGEVKVYGLLGRGEKELLVVDTNNSPYAKLVYRPDAGGSVMEAAGRLEKTGSSSGTPTNITSNISIEGQRGNLNFGSSKERERHQSPEASLSQLSQLPEDLAQNRPRGTSRKRHPPANITIPREPGLVKSNSARSPGADSLNVPTPSAPSPTPMSLRPRLIIPESPPILPHQYPPDIPISAASLRSERSIRSMKSNHSEASTMTVRTNPRPPEESTPYPDSGAPLSGYPENFFPSEKMIYGGDVRIHSAGPFSPNTPFEDFSPVSPEQIYWPRNDNLMRTPLGVGGWASGTPIGRKPEPFPWPAITGNPLTPNRSAARGQAKDSATPKDLRHHNSQSPQSNSSSNRPARTEESGRSASVNSKGVAQPLRPKEPIQPTEPDNQSMARPSSPKSRNASRSGMRERSGSSLENRESDAAISLHLEGISFRAESASRMRAESASRTPVGDRVQPSESRNCSRPRITDTPDHQQEKHMIRIVASPSILQDEQRTRYQSLSRVTHHQRRNSSVVNRAFSPSHDRTGTPESAMNKTCPASRAASRGRTPGPKFESTNGVLSSVLSTTERASSADSTRNDRLHSRIHQHGSSSRQSRADRTSSTQTGRRRSSVAVPIEFERVEEIRCPNCPVHSRRSTSVGAVTDATRLHASQSPPKSSPAQRPASSAGISHYLQPEGVLHRRASSGHMTQLIAEEPLDRLTDNAPSSSQNEAAEASDCGSFAETLQTVSTPGRSPATPSFNPSTPKAMVLNTNDLEVEPLFGGNLDGSEKTPTSRCAETDAMSIYGVPTSTAA
ncbi:unnamed protein product [Fusarium venenatum]|uniref:CN hydrolase domain-containing protein n=1 Tax=Fusarium venenatum TaxID=56646 RepID=A0A2L2T5U8_9HYPO|nr:uncharacterized protein FVRRES_11999 [Fusarium venenatum]CEI39308.1 unnamed protein product [Fusarium venenatum]